MKKASPLVAAAIILVTWMAVVIFIQHAEINDLKESLWRFVGHSRDCYSQLEQERAWRAK